MKFVCRLFPLFFLFWACSVFAQEASRAAVVWLPLAITADQPTVAVLRFSGLSDWEARLYVKSTEHYSGSVQRGDGFTSGYIPLEELLSKDNLIFKLKISSILASGEAEWRLALRKKGSEKKIGEITLGKVSVIQPKITLEGQTIPFGWVGLFLDEKERLPYLIGLADANGKFSFKTDRTGKLFLLKDDGSREEIKEDETPIETPIQRPFQTETDAEVFISALLPNPASPLIDAQDEWIEIATISNRPQDISGYRLSDTIGAVKEYILPAGSIVSKEKPLKIFSRESKIVLNNEGDVVVLKTPDGKIISESVKYPAAPAGAIWFKDENEWLWEQEEEPKSDVSGSLGFSSQGTTDSSYLQPVFVEIGEIDKLTPGSFITTIGRVSGKISTGFYLADKLGNKIRVFLNKAIRGLKDLVKNKELWQVTGKLEIYAGSLRLSPQNESDLKKIAQDNELETKEESLKTKEGKITLTTTKNSSSLNPEAEQAKKNKDNNLQPLSLSKNLAKRGKISYPLTQVIAALILWWGLLFKIQ